MAPSAPLNSSSPPAKPAPRRGLLHWLVLANLAVIASIAALLAVTLNASREAHRQRAFDAVATLALGLERNITAELARVDFALMSVGQHLAAPGSRPLAQVTADVARMVPEAERLRVLEPAAATAVLQAAARDTPSGQMVIAGPRRIEAGDRWVLDVAHRIEVDGAPRLVVAEIDTLVFESLFASLEFGGLSAATLRMADLALVARHTDPPTPRSDIGSRGVSAELHAALAAQPRGGSFLAVTVLDGVERAAAYRRVGPHPLIVIVGQATTDYLRAWRQEARLAGGLAFLAAALLVTGSAFAYRAWRRENATRRERDRERERLRASEAFLDRTGRIAGVGGWELDLVSGRLQLTAQARQLLELPPTTPATWRRALRLFSPADRRRLVRLVAQARVDRHAWDLELPGSTPRARPIWLRCFGEPVIHQDAVVRITGAVQDVTERHARTAELRREQLLRAELERQGREQARMLRERGEMLDVLAHEVRQPLNNASAALQAAAVALRELAGDAARQRLDRAQNVVGQVMARIDNTLAVASLLARPGPVEREETDLDMLVAVAVADMPAGERSRVRVRRETATRSVPLDMNLMRLALRNLLSNALKYSPAGSPVTVRLSDTESPLGWLIDVTDLGGGVEPALQGRLFERGVRGRGPGSSHGLGLYIVRRVMELHGGQAMLLATGPQGTTMRLVLVVADSEDD